MLKVKEGFILKEVCGEYLIVPIGEASIDFKSVIKLNETGAFLWEQLAKGADEKGLLDALLKEYDVPADIAQSDISAFLLHLTDAGVVE